MASAGSIAATDSARVEATEQTPLLQDEPHPATGHPEGSQEHGETLKEPSMREIIIIMSSIWLGVFLAALGMCSAFVLHSSIVRN